MHTPKFSMRKICFPVSLKSQLSALVIYACHVCTRCTHLLALREYQSCLVVRPLLLPIFGAACAAPADFSSFYCDAAPRDGTNTNPSPPTCSAMLAPADESSINDTDSRYCTCLKIRSPGAGVEGAAVLAAVSCCCAQQLHLLQASRAHA